MPETTHVAAEPPRHESQDINSTGIMMAAGALLLAAVIAHLAALWVFSSLTTSSTRAGMSGSYLFPQRQQVPAEPRLEEINRLEAKHLGTLLAQPDAAEQQRLDTYGWVDEKAGIVRIPIEQAMRILVEDQRMSSRPKSAPRRAMPSAANSGRLPKEDR